MRIAGSNNRFDEQLREDLRKPERIVSPGGRVIIAAVRDGNGHADHFWSMALAIEAAFQKPPAQIQVLRTSRPYIPRNYLL
jgi:phage FluMu gp28-like protein